MTSDNKNVKYRFGINDNNEIVDIFNLDKSHRHDNKIYCISCGHELSPVMGEIRKWHFRHKENISCNGETYIHELAKELIKQKFLTNNHLYISLKIQKTCNLIEKCILPVNKNTCKITESIQYDLKKDYDRISIEKPIGNFVADILLEDSKGVHKPFLIEIYVTHKCSSEKINSKLPIFEIQINSEADALRISSEKILNGSLYNFPLSHIYTEKPIVRKWEIEIFSLLKSGECRRTLKTRECQNIINPNYQEAFLEYIFITSPPYQFRLIDFIRKAQKLGFYIKDCRICLHEHNRNCPLCYDKNPNSICAYGCPEYLPSNEQHINEIPYAYVLTEKQIEFKNADFSETYKAHKRILEEGEKKESRDKYLNDENRKKKNDALQILYEYFTNHNLLIAFKRPGYSGTTNWGNAKIIPEGYSSFDLKPFYNKCIIH